MRAVLPELVRILDLRSIIDMPVGDYTYMRHVMTSTKSRDLSFIGLDLVSALVDTLSTRFREPGRVEFMQFDMSIQTLWPADLVILRDILFHFDPQRGLDVLKMINKSGAKYLLTTFFPNEHNADYFTDHVKQTSAVGIVKKFHPGKAFSSFYRINLMEEPFNLPPPLMVIGHDGNSNENGHRVVGLWRLPL